MPRCTSGLPSFRYTPAGNIIGHKGPGIFPPQSVDLESLLAQLNSKNTVTFLQAIAPTMGFEIGQVSLLPYVEPPSFLPVNYCLDLSKQDWDAYETSWDFARLPLLGPEFRPGPLPAAYAALRARWQQTTLEMQRLEGENNRLFIDAYGLQDELDPTVSLNEITLTCNPHYRYGSARLDAGQWDALAGQFPATAQGLARVAAEMAPDTPEEARLGLEQRLLQDTVQELVSYAVGCMVGRYSLDRPGLILANQGETVGSYQSLVFSYQAAQRQEQRITFMPEADNVLPVLDGDWFTNDISERFKQFLRVAFGEAHYEENLAFVELALGRDVRGYFLRDFYADHWKRYNKRPIYWLFSSARGSFNALIYMHRYRSDTVSVVLNDYLREFRAKLAARKSHLEGVSISASAAPRDRTAALKEMEQIDKVLNELSEYEDKVLYPLAMQQVEIDLDDGVLVNYNKFGAALKDVPGLSEKSSCVIAAHHQA